MQFSHVIAFYGLTLAGLLDSTYLAYSRITARPLICDMIDGCNIVAASPYSLFMGIPLSFWGIAFYLIAAGAVWSAYIFPAPLTRRLLIGYTTLGILFSAYFVYLQLFVIHALCVYCLTSAGITVFMCILSLSTTMVRKEHV